MAELSEIVDFLDTELKTQELADYSGAHNGLQLENQKGIKRVVSAVDASEAVITKAVSLNADLLIVHHGMFWHGVQKLTGAFYRKVKLAMDNGLALYSSHIPLDIHPEWGNNILLAKALGMNSTEAFGDYKGACIGVRQKLDMPLDSLLEKVATAVGSPVHHCPGGNRENVGMVGIITGGAGSEIEAMVDAGIKTFITGEGPHWSFPLAEELGLNVIYAGHYATEVFGVQKVSSVLCEKFALDTPHFIDHPTGL